MKKLILLTILILLISGCSNQIADSGKMVGGITQKEFIVGGEKVLVGGEMLGAGEEKFKPEVKLEKWGDETYLKVWSEETGADTASQVGNKVVWETPKKTYSFYPLTAEEVGNEEGGFEYQVDLKEKPDTNVIELKIETKNLVFYYQPELTQEEKNNGVERPENVIGSYAVYHATKKNHIEGQTNYKTGKAFHIYRPQMEDANGNKVWGDLHIEDGIMRITIPQDFIDKAKYPVRHVTGATFGNSSVGESIYWRSANVFSGYIDYNSTTEGWSISSVSIYCKEDYSGTLNIKGIILDSTYIILTNGVGSSVTVGSSPDWVVSSVTATVAASEVGYVIGSIPDVGTSNLALYYDELDDQGLSDISNDYTTPTNPTDGTETVYAISAYFTYTDGGGTPAVEDPYEGVIIFE